MPNNFWDDFQFLDGLSRNQRFGTLSFFLIHDQKWPRPEPEDPQEVLRKQRSIESYEFRSEVMRQQYAFYVQDLMQLKYEMDKRAWLLDDYRDRLYTAKKEHDKTKAELLIANNQISRMKAALDNSSNLHGEKNEQLRDLRNQLEAKKALECIHGEDIMCDHDFWKRITGQHKEYQRWMAGLWLGSMIALIGGGWAPMALTFGIFATPLAYAGIRLGRMWVEKEITKKIKLISTSGEILDVAIRDIMAEANLLD